MRQNNNLIFVMDKRGKVECANKDFEGDLEFEKYDCDF